MLVISMKLYEFEGKELVKKYGIIVPESTLAKAQEDVHNPLDINKRVVKAQLLTVNSRAEAGAVKICDSFEETRDSALRLLKEPVNGEQSKSVLLEEKIDIKKEYYISITYDTETRSAVILFNISGGTGIEAVEGIHKLQVSPITGLHDWMIRGMLKKAGVTQEKTGKLADSIKRAYACFSSEDCRLLEINPLAETAEGKFVAVDVIAELDDDTSYRHKERGFTERQTRPLTEREAAVRAANAADYRGTIKYIELDGDIGFLAAGGGGSLTCMDALIKCGGKPANYTEYSGNPSAEKVYELTKQIISKPGLKGLWIVGAIANFTRVDSTMEGIARALAEMKPKFPIVARRSGPYEKDGLGILRKTAQENGLDMKIFGKEMPMTESAKIIAEAAAGFGTRK